MNARPPSDPMANAVTVALLLMAVTLGISFGIHSLPGYAAAIVVLATIFLPTYAYLRRKNLKLSFQLVPRNNPP